MSTPSEPSEYESLIIDDDGLLVLTWPRGVKITGPSARQAFDDVNRICAGTRRPMLVDMATTKSVAREARAVFGERSAASRIAMLGHSPVDRVIANFALGRSAEGAIGVVSVDEADRVTQAVRNELAAISAVKSVQVVELG